MKENSEDSLRVTYNVFGTDADKKIKITHFNKLNTATCKNP